MPIAYYLLNACCNIIKLYDIYNIFFIFYQVYYIDTIHTELFKSYHRFLRTYGQIL